MLKLVSTSEMKKLDDLAAAHLGVSNLILMERAGHGLARRVRHMLAQHQIQESQAQVVILAGSGKNGGDGLACARFLFQTGIKVQVLLLAQASLAAETQAQLSDLKTLGVEIEVRSEPSDTWTHILEQADLVVDALLGVGFRPPVRPPAAAVIQMLLASPALVLAADIPSGLNTDIGEISGPIVRADHTLTFGAMKQGLLDFRVLSHVGQLTVDTLGFPLELISADPAEPGYLDPVSAAAWLPRRAWSVHKKSAGRVLIIGGSSRYHGALLLAGQGALRAGAGFVTLAYPAALDSIIRAHSLEALCAPLPGTAQGDFNFAALGTLLTLAQTHDTVVLGPGLGREESSQSLARTLISKILGPKMLLVDADALAALEPTPRAPHQPVLVITPHAGEAGRLLQREAGEIMQEATSSARQLADQWHAVSVLKGRHTMIATPTGRLVISSSGTPALATAGTGDVLAGVIAALAAQGLEAWVAASLGAYLHGRAGVLASVDPQGLGVLAHEVADALPQAIQELRLTRPWSTL